MKRQILTFVLGFILLAGMIMPLAMGENDSLHVIMTVADRNYSVGDTVTIQMQIYNQGILTDVTDIQDIYIGTSTSHNFNNPSNLTVIKSGTGIYTTTYTIKAADNNQRLYFFYDVMLGNDHEETVDHNDALEIDVYSITDNVDVSFDGQEFIPAQPGDIVTATILTRTGTTLIPVTGFNQLYAETPTGLRQNLSYTEQETGIYIAEFTVPTVSASGAYQIVAQPMGMGDQDSATIQVNVLDVWCHKIATAGTTVSFEVCVADLLGAPVEGANFMLERIGWPNDVFTGVTNASGKALVHVPDVTGTVGFGGYVMAGGQNQTISGTLFNQIAAEPDHNSFDIIWEGTESIFEPGSDVTIPYVAYDERLPAASRIIYYYVSASGTDFDMLFGTGNHQSADREVIATGTATTDNLGKFSLTFTTPEKQCNIHVNLEVPLDHADFSGQDYDQDDDHYYMAWPENQWNDGFIFHAYEGNLDGDREVGISGGSFNPGKAGTVTVELSAATGDRTIILWGIGEGNLETGDFNDQEWTHWVPAGYLLRMEQTESGKYTASFLVPEFIEDQDVTIVSGYMDSADGTPHFDSKTISPGSSSPWLWIILAIIIIVVVIVLVVVIRNRF